MEVQVLNNLEWFKPKGFTLPTIMLNIGHDDEWVKLDIIFVIGNYTWGLRFYFRTKCKCTRYAYDRSKAVEKQSIEYNGSEFEVIYIKCKHGKVLLDTENNVEVK